jgi:bifunctional oligoribonuclease and PAP phosphatase NrnA
MSTTLYNPELAQQIDPLLVQEAMALIEPAQHIALLAHQNPDGDCLGSALGFAFMLQEMGKICVPVCIDPPPGAFRFLPDIDTFQNTLGDERFDLVIALDAGELTRYGALYDNHRAFLDSATILNIDHHISSQGCGQVNIIDPASAATAELLILFQQQAKLTLNKDAATCLLTGIITDTASFQHSSTTARTMEIAAILLRAGAIPETIIRPIFRTQPLAQMRFRSLVIEKAQTSCNGRLIWSYANDEMLATASATADMDDNFSAVLRDVEGVQIAVLFKSYGDPQTTRMSIRSAEPYNAAEFCGRFGGGGHARAAGATISLPLQEAMQKVIAELEQEIKQHES